MRINARLRLNAAITLGLLLLMTAALIWSTQTTMVADANDALVGKMQISASERVLVRDDYLIQPLERARIQWEAETEDFRGLLAQARVQLPAADQSILDGIESDFVATVSIFNQIVEIVETPVPAGADGLPSPEGEQRLVSQLLLQAYSLNNRVLELRDATQAGAGAAHTLLMWLMFSFMLVAAVATLASSALIQRLLTRRIKQLREGMDFIGAGHLDHRIPVAGNDELSDLARAGNVMAARLMETTTSVENLQREVAERKLAEEGLQETLEELETTLHSIGDAVISADLEGCVRRMNPVAEQLTGWTEAEAQGRSLEEVFHIVQEETRTPVENPVQRVLREGLIVGLANHTLLIDRNGVERPIADSGAPIRGEGDATLGVVLAFRDQTRERAAEKELHGLMERQQAILAAVPDIIVEVDRHKIITWSNQAGQEFYGDDVIGHEAADYFEGEEDVYEVVRPLFNGSSPAVYVESRQRRKDGQIRLLAWWCRSLTDDRGNVIGALSSAQDITERKRAEEKLRESEERYRSIMEQAADTVIMHDETGRIVDANRQACRSLGYSREELLSKSIGDIDPEAVQAEKQELWGKVLAGEQFTFESLQIRKDGSVIPVEVTLGSVRLPLGPAIIGIVRDITERKQLEKDTAKARADFLYAVSHELKTPLFLMTATVEMMKLQTEEERRFRFMSQEETWIRNLARLRLLINNLVDSQRTATLGTQLTRTPTDLAALVRQAVEDLDVFAVKQSITWQIDLNSLPDLPLDPEAIERTMHNLLTNAIKFSPPGGTVQIRLRAQPDQVALEIEDHGKGIPAAEMSRLFQPFARAGSAVKAVIPGTGLGLYVSKVLVEAHGGAISLRSEEGVGTTVTVTLPLRE